MNDHAYIDHGWQFFAFFIDEFTNFDAKGHIRIATQDLKDWLNDGLGEGRHYRAKSSANDDTSGKVDNIAFENEFFNSLSMMRCSCRLS